MNEMDEIKNIVNQINAGKIKAENIPWQELTNDFCTNKMQWIIHYVDEDKLENVKNCMAQCWYNVIGLYDWQSSIYNVPPNLRRSTDWTTAEVLPREPLFSPQLPGTPDRIGRPIESLMHTLKITPLQGAKPMASKPQQQPQLPEQVKMVLRNKDFKRETMKCILDACYNNKHVNMALIEKVLSQEGVLLYPNLHMDFLKALQAWGLLDVANLKNIASGMADKVRKIKDNPLSENDKMICSMVSNILQENS